MIAERIKQPLANEILFGALAEGGEAQVDYVDDELKFEYFPLAEAADEEE